MSNDKYCGNCKHFKNEDVEGWGWCSFNKTKTHCDQSWDCHNNTFNGWTEITPNNVEELYESKERVCVAFVCNGEVSYTLVHSNITLSTMAKYGGYYYYVLPELKIE